MNMKYWISITLLLSIVSCKMEDKNLTKQIVNTEYAPKALGPYNQSVRFGDIVFISGQIAIDPVSGEVKRELDIQGETTQVLENLRAILKAHGLSFENVLKADVFLTDMENYSTFNSIYAEYFPDSTAPARVLVEVAELPAGVEVEIALTAGIE